MQASLGREVDALKDEAWANAMLVIRERSERSPTLTGSGPQQGFRLWAKMAS